MLERCDVQFGRILDALDGSGRRDVTLVMVLSDHGHITVTEEVPLFQDLTRAGFLTAAVGGDDTVLLGIAGVFGELRVSSGDERTRDRVIGWLQEHPAVGHLFMRDVNGIEGAAPGTLSTRLVGLDHARAPDIAFTFRSDTTIDRYDLPGQGLFMEGVPVGAACMVA